MAVSITSKRTWIIPLIIYLACLAISFTPAFALQKTTLTHALIGDLVLTAPVLWFLAARTRPNAKWIALRLAVVGIFLSSMLMPSSSVFLLRVLRTWIAPAAELGLVIWLIHAFRKKARRHSDPDADFPMHCRKMLQALLGNEKMAAVLSSEISVFYYCFYRTDKESTETFTSWKKNGVRLLLSTFLSLFLIETTGMHFLIGMWNHTAAWIITALGLYSCMQLFAHIRALKLRPIRVKKDRILLFNGLLGGEVVVDTHLIKHLEQTTKAPPGKGFIKLSLFSVLEPHNIILHLSSPVVVWKAFGMRRTSSVLLFYVDDPDGFIRRVHQHCSIDERC